MTHLGIIDDDIIIKIMDKHIGHKWTMKKNDFRRLKRMHISIS